MGEKLHRLGLSKRSEYSPWAGMVARCTKPNATAWKYYGGRGITVFDGWRGPGGFAAFLDHIGPRPSPIHSIDRIDGTKGYHPGNVRWATPTEQGRNRSDNVLVEHDGVTRCISEWAELVGIKQQSLHKRIAKWEN